MIKKNRTLIWRAPFGVSQPQRFVFQSYAANLPGQDNCICIIPHLYLLMKPGCIFYRKITPPLFAKIIFSPKSYICCDEGRLNCTHCTNLLIFNCKLLLWNHVKTTLKNLLRPNDTFMTKLGYMTKWCYMTNYLSHYLETDLKN